ncbi:MAG: DUF3109 family protein [Bacteroidetes bacterium]|nr:MAG: DUF3109 family protein [Bacteroidota bacterium]
MLIVQNAVISDDIAENMFVCHLEKCKGACCSAGDLGAPLEISELQILDQIFEQIKPYLSERGIREIQEQGKYVKDSEGDFSTTLINGKDCAYSVYDSKGFLKCGIENAYKDGKTSFKKPISCHLYPIRIEKYDEYETMNYHQWDICAPACSLGSALAVPLYQFLKEPLIRKYGQIWYEELEQAIAQMKIDKTEQMKKIF